MKKRMMVIILAVVSIIISFLLYEWVDILHKGGPVMVPIILCSIYGLSVAIEKRWQLHNVKVDIEDLKKNIMGMIRKGKTNEAIAICDSIQSPISRILKAGIRKHGRTKEEIQQAMEDASLYEIPALEKNLTAVATVAHISPLLGLLGTVTGLVRCFQTIQLKSSSFSPINPGDLAGGIWEALITTVAGLIVAIPMYVTYNYLVSKVNSFILDMERSSTDLINFLSDNK